MRKQRENIVEISKETGITLLNKKTKSPNSKKESKIKSSKSKEKTPQKKSVSSKKHSKLPKETSSKKQTLLKKEDSSNLSTPIIEYYDLPYRYNKTVVKLLAQTPNSLFIYWDISDDDRNSYIKEFGDNFFDITIPVLRIYNKTMDYSYEVEINDFANCWYLKVNDANCEYSIELIRKAKNDATSLGKNILKISSSNSITSPNDHILFENLQNSVDFKNILTDEVVKKEIKDIPPKMEKIYNIYDLYKKLYMDENILDNPSSKFL